MLRVAALVQAIEAAGLCVASILGLIDAVSGRVYSESGGVGLAILGFIAVAMLAWVAAGLARTKAWSRTPAILTQVATGIVAVYLVQGGRFEWGIPGLVLAAAGLAGLLTPASFRALIRE